MTSIFSGPSALTIAICLAMIPPLARAAGLAGPPLPPPRPAGIDPPKPRAGDSAEDRKDKTGQPGGKPSGVAPAASPQVQDDVVPSISSACSGFLSSGRVEAKRAAAPVTLRSCGIDEPVTLSAIIRPDGRKISVAASGVMRCALAQEFAAWAAGEFSTILEDGGRKIETIVTGSSYECRGRNRVAGARLSEHARGNALDIRGVQFSGGARAMVGDKASPIPEALFASACRTFATVLGPGSDGYHEDHMHIDLAPRRPGSHYCRWRMP